MVEPRIETRPAFAVAGLKYRGKNENDEVPQLWWRLMPRVKEIEAIVNERVAYGVEGNVDEESGEFDYLAGYQVSRFEQLPEGMAVWEIPEQTYAIFNSTLPTIRDTHVYVFRDWFPGSTYLLTDGPMFELYGSDFVPDDPDSPISLYFPIREK